MFNPYSLENKTILVTGASSGIGKSVAVASARLGAKVLICGRNETRLDETYHQLEGNGHIKFVGDLTDPLVVDSLVESSPVIEGLVLSAGKGLTLPLQFSTREKFNSIFDINFFAPVEILRTFYKKKKLSSKASVVIIDSIGGSFKFSPGNAIYGSSKAALASVVRFAALEFSKREIRVNTVCPGMVETPLIYRGTLTQEQYEADKAKYPLKRYGQPEDIAYGVIYLLSDASSWVTGHSLVIDGGISI